MVTAVTKRLSSIITTFCTAFLKQCSSCDDEEESCSTTSSSDSSSEEESEGKTLKQCIVGVLFAIKIFSRMSPTMKIKQMKICQERKFRDNRN